jgi:hypothetical protein
MCLLSIGYGSGEGYNKLMVFSYGIHPGLSMVNKIVFNTLMAKELNTRSLIPGSITKTRVPKSMSHERCEEGIHEKNTSSSG